MSITDDRHSLFVYEDTNDADSETKARIDHFRGGYDVYLWESGLEVASARFTLEDHWTDIKLGGIYKDEQSVVDAAASVLKVHTATQTDTPVH